MAGEPHDVLRREEGRRLFGLDPSVYEAGRPQYPSALYRALEDRCGLAGGARVLEVGPGTGLVTRRLLGAGASVVAVEPDANMAAHLRDAELTPAAATIATTRPTSHCSHALQDTALPATQPA